MNQKLQELTEKIYKEGVEKAEVEARQIIAEAEEQAQEIISKAEKKAQQLKAESESAAEELRRNVQSELQLSAEQAVSGLKQEIAQLITTKLLSAPLKTSLSDTDFLKQLIETAIRNWNPQGGHVELQVLLPEQLKTSFDQHFADRLREELSATLTLTFQGRLKDGFRIGPGDGSYQISFTSEDFERFFRSYLREQTRRILYGEEQ